MRRIPTDFFWGAVGGYFLVSKSSFVETDNPIYLFVFFCGIIVIRIDRATNPMSILTASGWQDEAVVAVEIS